MKTDELANLIIALDIASTNIIKLVMDLANQDKTTIEEEIAKANIKDEQRASIMARIKAL